MADKADISGSKDILLLVHVGVIHGKCQKHVKVKTI